MQIFRPLAIVLSLIPGTAASAPANPGTATSKSRMCLSILTMAFAAVASHSQAGDPIRTIAELEPITPALERLKPDFEAGGFRVDTPSTKIVSQLYANGFTITFSLLAKSAASIDGKGFETDEYNDELKAFKISEDKSRKEMLTLKFLPGQGGVAFISRHVEFRYEVGQTRLKRQELEAALTARFGNPLVRVQKIVHRAESTSNDHVMGLYCFEADRAAMTDPDKCDIEKAHTDGYFYDIEVDKQGDVLSTEEVYDASSYAKSYMDALYAKMHSLIEDDQKPWWRMGF